MIILGITGSSGAGKTTLSQILNKREDVLIIDADKVCREMSVPGTDYLNSIEDTFGKEIILEDGNLNRKLLAKKIYNDNESRKKLNDLTFYYVSNEINRRIEKINDPNIKLIVLDAPLLFESGLNEKCDYIIGLVAEKELKIERICLRDGIDRETAIKRLNIQQEDEYYISRADYVILNKKNFDLKKEIEKIIEDIKKKGSK